MYTFVLHSSFSNKVIYCFCYNEYKITYHRVVCSHVTGGNSVCGDPVNNSPLMLSVTVTLNQYSFPPCSPDTTPDEEVAENEALPLIPSTVV